MNFVTSDVKTRSCPAGAVANMSLGGGTSSSINSAAKAMINAGVFLAVAQLFLNKPNNVSSASVSYFLGTLTSCYEPRAPSPSSMALAHLYLSPASPTSSTDRLP